MLGFDAIHQALVRHGQDSLISLAVFSGPNHGCQRVEEAGAPSGCAPPNIAKEKAEFDGTSAPVGFRRRRASFSTFCMSL